MGAHEWAADLRRTLVLWRRAPALPIVVATVSLLMALPQVFSPSPAGCGLRGHSTCVSGSQDWYAAVQLMLLPVGLFSVGLSGGQRWWYAQVAAGRRPAAGHLWRGSWAYFWRFTQLGLLVAAALVPVEIALISVHANVLVLALVLGVELFAIDIGITFATPILALGPPSAWHAVKAGLRMLRHLWPADWPYALIPPFAIAGLAQLSPDALGSALSAAVIGAVARFATSLFAGATLLYYLRHELPDTRLDPGIVKM